MNPLRLIQSIVKTIMVDRETERVIRDWLTKNGFNGNSANLFMIELFAIQRPGWLQIFRFSGNAVNSLGQRVPLFGVVTDDQRYGAPLVKVFDNLQDQTTHLKLISTGMILRRR